MSIAQRFHHAMRLTRQSAALLAQQKSLIVLPLVSGACLLLITATFMAPIVVSEEFRTALEGDTPDTQVMDYLYLFAFYLIAFTVMNIFNGALLHCVLARIAGRPVGVGAGLSAAMARLPQILAWSLVSATLGLVLQVLRDKAGFVGKLFAGLAGIAWSVATYFAFPLIIAEGIGPMRAVTESGALLRRTWGEMALTNVGISLLFWLAFLVLVPVFLVLFAFTATLESPAAMAAVGAVFAVLMGAAILIVSTLSVVLRGALFVFARDGAVPGPFEREALAAAIRPKKDKS